MTISKRMMLEFGIIPKCLKFNEEKCLFECVAHDGRKFQFTIYEQIFNHLNLVTTLQITVNISMLVLSINFPKMLM